MKKGVLNYNFKWNNLNIDICLPHYGSDNIPYPTIQVNFISELSSSSKFLELDGACQMCVYFVTRAT